MFAMGAALLVIGVGAKIEEAMIPPSVWDIDDPPAERPYRNSTVRNAICRLDDRSQVDGRPDSIVPLVKRGYAKPASGHDYAKIPLLYYAPRAMLRGKEAIPCEPYGSFIPVSSLPTLEAGIKKRFPGFAGLVVEFPEPTAAANKKNEDLLFDVGLLSIAFVLAVGGARAFYLAKRSAA